MLITQLYLSKLEHTKCRYIILETELNTDNNKQQKKHKNRI